MKLFKNTAFPILIFLLILSGCSTKKDSTITIFLIGDSTVANYADNYDEDKDYYQTRYPVTGWGQVFQELFVPDSLDKFSNLFQSDSVLVDDRAKGGRSTRTFFQEGRWRGVYDEIKKGDLVLMQFGHNDGAIQKTERYVDTTGYKEFLRLFVSQSWEKGAIPIILTPVARNFPWENGHLENVHGDYPQAAKEVAEEMQAYLIDLNQLSMDAFSLKGKDYVTEHYFMNLPAGKYEAYPAGNSDNTHFQPEGARAVAKLVFNAMQSL